MRTRRLSIVGALAWVLLAFTTGSSSAQLFWTQKADFLDPRTGTGIEGSCASLIGGKIYVSHGFRGFDSNLLSIYDIGSDTWTHGGASAPDAAVARSELAGGTAFGRHYAFGGRTGPNADVEEFDPGTTTWTPKAPMSFPRAGAGGASWQDLIYVVGGRDGATFGTGAIFATNERYDAATNTWTPLAPMLIPVSDNYATVAHNGKVYVFGGATGPGTVIADTQIYDIATDTWIFGAPMPTARGAAMAGVICDLIAVFGGFDTFGNLDVTEFYDPITDTWMPGPAMAVPVSEVAQGVTFDALANQVWSIGSGIFGPSETVVQVLEGQCPTVPADNVTWGKVKSIYR